MMAFVELLCGGEHEENSPPRAVAVTVRDVGDEFLHPNFSMRLFIVHVYTANNCNKNMHLVTSSF